MNPVIINYGMGNLRSVANACEALGFTAKIAASPDETRGCSHIILPGVGAFGDAMKNLSAAGWIEVLEDEVRRKGKFFLGLCLGMQVLAAIGTEFGMHKGLGWIDGSAVRLETGEANLRIPHMGWNNVRAVRSNGLFQGLPENAAFYFVHSYVLQPARSDLISGRCTYGTEFAAAVEAENIQATQFHPEKSQKAGLAVLKNFLVRRG
jgi:glutamine amidotransferase